MTATASIRWRSYSLHKDGLQPDEYEDAFAGNPKTGRFAVADGASESSFASLWAKLLVEGFVAAREGRTTIGWLPPLQQRWAEAVDHLELDWFGEEKRQQGAFATFLGISFKKPQEGKEGRWKALAVGDSCLFQVRDNARCEAFPLSSSADFGNRPKMLGSRGKGDALAQATVKLGKWQPGDRFFLMTDALAQWFLRQDEEKHKPWLALGRKMVQKDATTTMTAYVEELRRKGELRNDDTTLLVIGL